MSATNKRRGPNPMADMYPFIGLIGGYCVVSLIMWVAAKLATPSDQPGPPFFFALIIGLTMGKYLWPGTEATVYAVLLSLPLVAVAVVGYVLVRVHRAREVLVDRAIPYLAKPKDLQGMTTAAVREKARKYGVPEDEAPGVFVGRMVRTGIALWGSWEDMQVDIWGPRTGKTVTRAIPNIVAAPGAVVVTSNKRDIVDATRAVRARRGRVYVFDPQQQATEPPSWYWDPLSYVGDSIVRAVKMAGRFSSINRPGHARSDAYFEPAAEDLIANLLLAASIGGYPITQVYTWLTRPNDDTAYQLLLQHGHFLAADAVDSVATSPDRQRAGVYGTASQIASFLIAPTVTEWVTPGMNPNRPSFDYKAFARSSTDTLYMLSEETNKMAAPLVLALTAAIAEEAENVGIASPNGRLATPMLFVLDEAANVCPWKALPDKYSHFGSRGIVMMTIFQSWAQGAAAFGDVGMQKLWGAANVRVYGGGVSENKFLSDLSAASGVFEPFVQGYSRASVDFFKKNISYSTRSEVVLDVADLTSMPRGRAFVQFSGTKPVLVKTVPWWETPYADSIQESLDIFDPGLKLQREAEAKAAAEADLAPEILGVSIRKAS